MTSKSIAKGFAFWIFVAFCFATKAYLEELNYGVVCSYPRMLAWEILGWILWGIFTPFIFAFARRYPPQKKPIFHIPAALGLSALHLTIQYNIFSLADKYFLPSGKPDLELMAFDRMAWRLMVYGILLIVWYASDSQRKANLEQERAAQLSVQLAKTQLQALKMQLHPHFLFNTLNTISELMHHDIRAADEMMVRLGDFLRLTLDPNVSQEVTLEKELEFLKHYLEIEQVRFKDRLKVEMHIQPNTRHARVPYLLLQPVVENAIRHGISAKADGGILEISSEKENGFLHITIQDNGRGVNQDEMKEGLGLSNTKSRLEKLYGDRFQFELSNRPGSGTIVELTIPFAVATS
jgi:two-component system, LytTR family, sensor kinase